MNEQINEPMKEQKKGIYEDARMSQSSGSESRDLALPKFRGRGDLGAQAQLELFPRILLHPS